MEDRHNLDQEHIQVNATEIIKKLDRRNFCLEKDWYHPNEIGFDTSFKMF